MAYRRSKTDHHARSHGWIDRHRAELAVIGLPAEVYLDEARWHDFLENGHLHWHESSGFEFGDLSAGQLVTLHPLLDREYGAGERSPTLLQWLRVQSKG
jgi:hypothetical protein